MNAVAVTGSQPQDPKPGDSGGPPVLLPPSTSFRITVETF